MDPGIPLHGFRFHVRFVNDPISGAGSGAAAADDARTLCDGAFSEISGLEAAMEAKVIKEGGGNYGTHQRSGQVSFATVVLKRGVTSSRDLWRWWELFAGGAHAHRMTVRITMKDIGDAPVLCWRLDRAMPVKFKAADLNARATELAIEELHLAHEGLFLQEPA